MGALEFEPVAEQDAVDDQITHTGLERGTYFVGDFTPWQLAGARAPQRVRRSTVFKRDPYWFAWASVSQGSNQLPVMIPATGPGAAGSTFPNNQPQVEEVNVSVDGNPPATYGSNLGRPAGPAANLPGGI